MKRFLPIALLLLLVADYNTINERDKHSLFLQEHPYSLKERLTPDDIKQMDKRDRPDLGWQQNFLQTLDPALGRPAPERLLSIYDQVEQFNNNLMAVPGAASSPWVERGPDNVGGRTRALMFDPNDPMSKKVWAGGVTGGLWVNNDITDPNSTWTAVDDFWDNIAVTAIAYDPTNTNIFYAGTGEGWGQSVSGARGEGVWKSTDGGATWNHLSATSSFYFVNDLTVRNESGSGVLYVALRGNFYGGSFHGSSDQGLQRSTDGGTSFAQVLPNVPSESINFAAADIEIAADNRIWVGTTTSSFSAGDRGGGRVLYSDDGTSWTIANSTSGGERVEVACAPNDANYVYAMVESGNQVNEIIKTTNKGGNWTNVSEPNDADNGIPSTDFSRGQAWYDMRLAVDPNDKDVVLAGAIDLFRTTDGGSNWIQISKWSNNNNLAALNCALVHADQHAIAFKPGSSSEVIFGNDGGVYYTNSIATAATNSVINARNNGYNVTQFYACAIHPTAATDYFLAGSQDNGTQQYNTAGVNSTTEVTGGDGAYCFIDQTDPNYQITSYVYNSYWRSTNGGNSFGSRFQNDQSTGKFINPADYDDNLDILYSARTNSTVNRVTGISTSPSIGSISVSGMSDMASHLRVSPYTTTSTTLFVCSDKGKRYKVDNEDGTPSTTSIGSASFPSGSISCVELGANENEILVTFFNYGVTSVWYTDNGGGNWTNKEGNLPDMPVRWALFNPNNRNEVILATEVGVWSSTNFNNASPTWSPSNSGLANVRVDMLQVRDSDQEVIAATHGRGLFSSSGFTAALPPTANFGADIIYPCLGETVSLADSSTNSPTSWSWSISPNTFTYVNSTSATSQDPQVQFSASGMYTITLTASNANGMDSQTRTGFITAGGLSLPYMEDFETSTADQYEIENPDNNTSWALTTVAGNAPGNTAMWVDNFNYNAVNERDGLITPPIDLTTYISADLDFEYAYRRFSSSNQDSLAVFISTNCGANWTRLASYDENGSGNFATGSDLNTAFTPAVAADWCGDVSNPACPTISLDAYVGNTVKIKFENINGWGNNMYLDNINITGMQPVAPVADFNASSTTVCPNQTVTFSDISTNTPTSWTWSFNPSTVNFVNGTNANSQNPQVDFTSSGTYDVTLTSTNSAGSDVITKTGYITVDPSVSPTVSIVADKDTICVGETVVFTATPTDGGTSPTYQWKVNGVNAGTNSSTFTSSSLNNNDAVTVEMVSNAICANPTMVTSNSVNITVNPTSTVAIGVTASQTSICTGDNVTFTAIPVNGGSSPTYQWKVNGINAGTNSSTFSTSTLANGDAVTVEMTSNAVCPSPMSITSTPVNMTVSSTVTPSVSITASQTSICAGDMVAFTASPTNGGASPSYQWKVNGVNAGSNSATFNSGTLTNGDVVSVVMTTSSGCASTPTATSNNINIVVVPTVTPSVSIVATSVNICQGESITFTATPTNGGTMPVYQWRVNGVVSGTNASTFSSSSLQNGDQVIVRMTSNAACPSVAQVPSNSLTVTVNPLPVVNINIVLPVNAICKEDNPFSLTANPTGGTWTGPGVSGTFFNPVTAGTGVHKMVYSYTDANGCSSKDSINIPVEIVPKPTISRSGTTLTCNESGYNYQWFKNGAPIGGATNQSFNVTSNGNYAVEIGTGSCFDLSDAEAVNDIGIEEYKKLYGFEVYPNPTRNKVNMKFSNPGESTLKYELIAFDGAIVKREEFSASATVELEVNLTALAKGIYTLRVLGEKKLYFTEKVNKQ